MFAIDSQNHYQSKVGFFRGDQGMRSGLWGFTSAVFTFSFGCGGGLPVTVSDDPTDLPLAGLSDEWEARFFEGDRLFEVPYTAVDGLGPLFIRQACASCHTDGGRGPGFVEKVAQVEADGVSPVLGQPALPFGHTVRPMMSAGAKTPLIPPSTAGIKASRRVGPSIWAAGSIEAIAEEELFRLEALQSSGVDGVTGRLNRVVFGSLHTVDRAFHDHRQGDVVVGRFGFKARVGYLDDFTADAFQGDMGLTSDLRPNEPPNPDGLTDDAKPGLDLPASTIAAVAAYVRTIRIPRRAVEGLGALLFERVGCAVCHVPSLKTSPSYPVSPLANTTVAVFSDLLLHDMGPTLADGLEEGSASASEFRTAPLVGVRFLKSFLHDGRATTLEDAVLQHGAKGSEASTSVTRFEQLSPEEKEALLIFVRSL